MDSIKQHCFLEFYKLFAAKKTFGALKNKYNGQSSVLDATDENVFSPKRCNKNSLNMSKSKKSWILSVIPWFY